MLDVLAARAYGYYMTTMHLIEKPDGTCYCGQVHTEFGVDVTSAPARTSCRKCVNVFLSTLDDAGRKIVRDQQNERAAQIRCD